MMNSIISLNNMISEALECVDAERNAKTRKKSHASKSRKQDFSRAKRHAKHCQYKQQRNEKLVHPAINRNAQRSIDEANCKLKQKASEVKKEVAEASTNAKLEKVKKELYDFKATSMKRETALRKKNDDAESRIHELEKLLANAERMKSWLVQS